MRSISHNLSITPLAHQRTGNTVDSILKIWSNVFPSKSNSIILKHDIVKKEIR